MKKLAFLALLAACGDDDPARHLDGGMTDAPDAAEQPVSLTITLQGQPQPNVVVHFQNADSSLVATEMTDSTGTASHVMAAGGYVTAVDPFEPAGLPTSNLRTFAGVKPGDHLKLNESFATGSFTMTVTLPVQAPTTITRYAVSSPCSPFAKEFTSSGSGFQPNGPMTFNLGCTTTDILAVAYDSGNQIVGYIYVPNQTLTADGTLDYSAQSYAQPVTRMYTLNNRPAAVKPTSVTQHVGVAKGELMTIGMTLTDTDSGSLTLPSIANSTGVIETSGLSFALESRHSFYDWGSLGGAFTTDLGARKLVDLSAPSYDIATHTLAWTEGTGVAPEAGYFRLFGTRTTASNNNFGVDWQLVAPHGGASVKFPTVPAGAVDYNFDADDTVDIQNLALVKFPGGYDAIRANGFMFDNLLNRGEPFEVPTASGAAEIVEYRVVAVLPPPPARPTALRNRIKR